MPMQQALKTATMAGFEILIGCQGHEQGVVLVSKVVIKIEICII